MDSIYTVKKLSNIPGLVHGFSTILLGNMASGGKGVSSIRSLAELVGISTEDSIGMEQIHGNSVYQAKNIDKGKIIDGVDSLWSNVPQTFLYGTFADCVPVLFYDTHLKMIGIVHSGWRGTYHEVVRHLLLDLIKHGSDPKDILVGIGPSIRICCYIVSHDVAQLFQKKFHEYGNDFLLKKNDQNFLSLQTIIYHQLVSMGIQRENIEDLEICTRDNADIFYSYRKQHVKKNHKVFAGIIGMV